MTTVLKMFASWYGVWFWPVHIVSMAIQSMTKRCFGIANVLDMAQSTLH